MTWQLILTPDIYMGFHIIVTAIPTVLLLLWAVYRSIPSHRTPKGLKELPGPKGREAHFINSLH
jgi:uncharacterized BrkB/YihY/UPF0761 family membrane protein